MLNVKKEFQLEFNISKCRAALRSNFNYQGTFKNEVNENCFELKNIALRRDIVATFPQYVTIMLVEISQSSTLIQIQTSPFSTVNDNEIIWQSQMEELIEMIRAELVKILESKDDIFFNSSTENQNNNFQHQSKSEQLGAIFSKYKPTQPQFNPQLTELKTSSQSKTIKSPQHMEHIGKIIIGTIAAIIIFIVFLLIITSGDKPENDDNKIINRDAEAISCAKQLIDKDLKNPDSAVWNNSYIVEKDNYDRYIVYIDVSAQNGFGGYVRDRYYVGVRLTNTDVFYFNKYLPYMEADPSSLQVIKEGIDWGKLPED